MLSRPALHEPPPTTRRDSRACLSSRVGNNPALFPGNMAYLPPPACRPRSHSGWLSTLQSLGSRHSENPAAVSLDSFPIRDCASHYSQNSPEIPKRYSIGIEWHKGCPEKLNSLLCNGKTGPIPSLRATKFHRHCPTFSAPVTELKQISPKVPRVVPAPIDGNDQHTLSTLKGRIHAKKGNRPGFVCRSIGKHRARSGRPGSQRCPHLDHVFVIMMENHGYQQILSNPNEPYL